MMSWVSLTFCAVSSITPRSEVRLSLMWSICVLIVGPTDDKLHSLSARGQQCDGVVARAHGIYLPQDLVKK